MFPNAFPRPDRVAAVIVVLVLVGVGIWFYERAGDSTPVSEDRALRDFRESAAAVGARESGVPAPGVYTYSQRGRETGGIGPVGVSRDLPAEARYVITRVPGGYQEELSISEQHMEAVRLRMRPRGSRAVWRRTEVTFVGLGRDDRRDLVPPPLHIARDLRVGRTWSDRYRAGELPVTSTSRVVRADVVELEGRRHAVRVIRIVGRTGGSHPGVRTDELWWSPALAMPLRWVIDMRITGVAELDTRATLELRSATPKV